MLSVAASRLVCFIVPVFLGLTPQAMNIPPLRGSGRPTHFAAASRGHPTRMGAIRKRVPPLRGSARSPHADGGDHNMAPLHGFGGSLQEDGGEPGHGHRHFADSQAHPTMMPVPRLVEIMIRGQRRRRGRYLAWGVSPRKPRTQLRPAPKGRQIPSLGRQPQETAHPTPTSPEGATDSGPGWGRHDYWRKKWQEHSAT